MLKSIRMSVILAASLLTSLESAAAQAQTGQVQSTTLVSEASALLASWESDDAPGVSVAISLNDQIVLADGYGMANLEHRVPLTAQSVFQVASVSKQFTAFAVLLLVDEGTVDLDRDIRDYLPEMPLTNSVITVRHLLDHSSGLREKNTLAAMAGWMPDDVHTTSQHLDLVYRQRGVNFSAGAHIEYSNTGYALLAEIVARASGQSFASFMRDRIFEPLDMTQTVVPAGRNSLIPDRAAAYFPAGNGFNNVISASEGMGSTGIYTSAVDLLKWTENFETKRVGSRNVFDMMRERFTASDNQVSTFGRGQELRRYNGLETWSHGGRDAGYRAFLLRIPEADFELAILSNRTDFDSARIAFALTDIFLSTHASYRETPLQDWSRASRRELAAYEGDYEIYPGVLFSIREQAGRLMFASFGAPLDEFVALPQIGAREFQLSETADLALVFETPIAGRSEGFGYRIGLHGTIQAERVDLHEFDASGANLAEFEGRCTSEELGTSYRMARVDGQLFAEHLRLEAFALTPYQVDTFMGQGPLQRLEFVRDANDRPVGFHASGPLAENIWFDCDFAHGFDVRGEAD